MLRLLRTGFMLEDMMGDVGGGGGICTWWYSRMIWRVSCGTLSIEPWKFTWSIFSISSACLAIVCRTFLVISRNLPNRVFSVL